MTNTGLEKQPMIPHELIVETKLRMQRPAHAVFEAIVNPALMSAYFISSGSHRLDAGQALTWTWEDVGRTLEVSPFVCVPNERLGLEWSASGVATRVVFGIEELPDDTTLVHVLEAGWPMDPEGSARCLQQTKGWVHMLCCMKAYLEHGIDLREGGVVE